MRSNTTIADLHDYIQIIMGWEDYHLNKFIIRQGYYGVYHIGGMSFKAKIMSMSFEQHNNNLINKNVRKIQF